MKLKRIFGWILIIGGLAIIITTLYFSFLIFTGKSVAPELFKYQEAALVDSFNSDNIEKMVEEQIKNMVPSEFTTQLFNLLSWSIFAGLLIFGGSKISLIGIKLSQKRHYEK